MMALSEYNKQLAAHDWYYVMSDDHRVYKKGRKSAIHIEQLSRISDNHASLYKSHQQFHFSGPHFNKPQAPRPKLAFWWCPESDGIFITTDADEFEVYDGDMEVNEIEEGTYLELEKMNGN